MRNTITFYLNGKRHDIGADYAGLMLADYLREIKNLTGTKIVCAEGDCGACSVLRYFPHIDGIDSCNYLPINSCITPVATMDGSSLITIEALKSKNKFHPAQDAMIRCHGSQCGFCTPGFVMTLAGLVEEKIQKNEKVITVQESKNQMTGNLCRCTGYAPIIESALNMDLTDVESLKERFYGEHQKSILVKIFDEGCLLENDSFSFFAPKTLKEAIDYLSINPEAQIIGAGTDLSVLHNKRKTKLQKLVSLHLIHDLYSTQVSKDIVTIGARVTISEFRHYMKDKCPELSSYLDIFASPQIKNTATVVGNIANASPIGDLAPAFLALNASVIINYSNEIPLSTFFLAYRKTIINKGEIITGISFRLPKQEAVFKLYKNANRKDLDISSVNFAIYAEWEDSSKSNLSAISIAAGGVSAIPQRFPLTEDFLIKKMDVEAALGVFHSEFKPLSDLRASAAYRRVLAENFFRSFLTGDQT